MKKRNYLVVKVAFSSFFFLCCLYSSYLNMKSFDKSGCIIVARKVILFFVEDKSEFLLCHFDS